MAANLNVVIHDLCAYVKMWSTLRSLENTQEVSVARGNSYTSFVQQGIFFALSRLGRELFYQFHRQGSLKMVDDRAGSVHDARWWGGGGLLPYFTNTGMCRPTGSWFWSSWLRTGYPFQRRFLEWGIIFRTYESSSFISSHSKLFI